MPRRSPCYAEHLLRRALTAHVRHGLIPVHLRFLPPHVRLRNTRLRGNPPPRTFLLTHVLPDGRFRDRDASHSFVPQALMNAVHSIALLGAVPSTWRMSSTSDWTGPSLGFPRDWYQPAGGAASTNACRIWRRCMPSFRAIALIPTPNRYSHRSPRATPPSLSSPTDPLPPSETTMAGHMGRGHMSPSKWARHEHQDHTFIGWRQPSAPSFYLSALFARYGYGEELFSHRGIP